MLTRSKRFCCLKGRGPLNKILFGGNVGEVMAYRLILLMTPLPGHFTVPLIVINGPLREFLSIFYFLLLFCS
jgi:hypothetical protein